MKLSQAVNRLKFTISKNNKPNAEDVVALNKILEHLQKTQEETTQENLLFAKLYAFVLENFVRNYKEVNFANKELNKILFQPMSFRVECLLRELKLSELQQCFSDPILENKNEEELREIFKRYPKFEENFLTCWDWWDNDNVISHLNTNINLSIQNFKNDI